MPSITPTPPLGPAHSAVAKQGVRATPGPQPTLLGVVRALRAGGGLLVPSSGRGQELEAKRLILKLQSIEDKYAGDIMPDLTHQKQWRKVHKSTGEAETKFQIAIDHMEELGRYIPKLQAVLRKIEKAPSPDKKQGQIKIYQSLLKSIGSAANRAGKETPLLLGGPKSAVSYKTDINDTRHTEFGYAMQMNYSLRKGNEEWKLNRAQGTLEKFVDGKSANYAVSLEGGVRLEARNPDGTVDVSFALGTADEIKISGMTLKAPKTAVSDAWLYDNFATPASIKKAQQTLSQLASQIANNKLSYESKLSVAGFYKARAKVSIEAITDKTIKNERDKREEIYDEVMKAKNKQETADMFLKAAQQSAAASINLLRQYNQKSISFYTIRSLFA